MSLVEVSPGIWYPRRDIDFRREVMNVRVGNAKNGKAYSVLIAPCP